MIDQKEIERKLEEIRNEIESDKNNPGLYNDLGVGYYLKGEYEAAEKALLKALSIQKSASYYFNLGNVYAESGEHEKSIHSFMEAINLDPLHAGSLTNLAGQYEITGQDEKAVEMFLYITRIMPEDPLSHYNFGNYLLRQNKHIEAANCYEKALNCNKEFTEAYYNIAWILYKAGAIGESKKYIESGLQTDSAHKELNKLKDLIDET